MRGRHCTGFLIALLAAPLVARAEDLATLLARVADVARARVPLRADGHLTVGDAPPRDVVLLARGTTVYVEVRDGERALVRPGKVVVRLRDRPRRAPTGAVLAASDLLYEDLVPFTSRTIVRPQISDTGPGGIVVTGEPGVPSAYSLLVISIDPEAGVVTRTKCYRDTTTNMIKMLRAEDSDSVDGARRPHVLVADTFRPPRTTTLQLDWRTEPDARPGPDLLRGPRLLPPGGASAGAVPGQTGAATTAGAPATP